MVSKSFLPMQLSQQIVNIYHVINADTGRTTKPNNILVSQICNQTY